jgi:N-methylhydantoinase B
MPDIVVLRPLFVQEELLGFALTVVHHVDVGGMSPGGMPTYATEVYQEGLRIPPLKLYEGTRINETLVSLIEKNVRLPEKVVGDLMGQAAACFVGQERLRELIARYGATNFLRCSRELLDYSERSVRAELRGWKDGVYEFTDYVDDDGMGTGPVPIHVTLAVAGDSLRIDFEGTADQVHGSINCPAHSTRAACFAAIRCVMDPDLPTTSGFFRAITVTAPPRTVVNPVEPAATCNRALTLARVADAVFGALAQIVPDKTPACSEGMATPTTWCVREAGGDVRIWIDNHHSGRGGTSRMDGQEGIMPWVYNANNNSVEVSEANFPLRICQFGFVPDSGGPGKFRGSLATVREWEVLAPEVSLTFRADRQKHPPWGLAGGGPGRPSEAHLIAGERAELLPTKFTRVLQRGQRVRSIMQSGGGYGDPLERDPQLVLEDYREGKISAQHALDVYGVAVDDAMAGSE